MRNPAAPPVLHRFRGKQIHTNKEVQRSNESLFPKKTLNRFHNPSVVWILPVIGQGYFLQKNVLAIPERLPIHLAHCVSPTQKTDPVDACVLRESALLDCKKSDSFTGGGSVDRAKDLPRSR